MKKYWDRIIQHMGFNTKIRVGSRVQTKFSHFLKDMEGVPDKLNDQLVNGEVVKIENPTPGQKARILHVKLDREHNAAIEYADESVERMDKIVRIPEDQVIEL